MKSHRCARWFCFRVERLARGDYHFVVVGLGQPTRLHGMGVQIVARSANAAQRGIGWRRFGDEIRYFRWGTEGEDTLWALSFRFHVEEADTIEFAHVYPYTFSDLNAELTALGPLCMVSSLCRSVGGIDVPAIYWDAEAGKCRDVADAMVVPYVHSPLWGRERTTEMGDVLLRTLTRWGRGGLPEGQRFPKRPLIIVEARTHPGETVGSFAMEGFLRTLFSSDEVGVTLRREFSFLVVPMLNVDGVICGFNRLSLTGFDLNRVWDKPNAAKQPEVWAMLHAIAGLARNREVLAVLDFHGHSDEQDMVCYGVCNMENGDLCGAENVFEHLLGRRCSFFSFERSCNVAQSPWQGTMRVELRRRYRALFAYTLELSLGFASRGPLAGRQLVPDDYRDAGAATAATLVDLLVDRASGRAAVGPARPVKEKSRAESTASRAPGRRVKPTARAVGKRAQRRGTMVTSRARSVRGGAHPRSQG